MNVEKEDISPTLRRETGGHEPIIFGLDSVASNSMKLNNPQSGCHIDEVAKTLDASAPNPAKNQGGQVVVLDMMGGKAGCHFTKENACPTIATTHGDVHAVAIQTPDGLICPECGGEVDQCPQEDGSINLYCDWCYWQGEIKAPEAYGVSFDINYGCPIEKELGMTQKCGTASGNYSGVLAVWTANTHANGIGCSEECAYTLDGVNGQAISDNRTADSYVLEMRAGKPGGGKGALVGEERSFSIGTSNIQVLFTMEDEDKGVRKMEQNGMERKNRQL